MHTAMLLTMGTCSSRTASSFSAAVAPKSSPTSASKYTSQASACFSSRSSCVAAAFRARVHASRSWRDMLRTASTAARTFTETLARAMSAVSLQRV